MKKPKISVVIPIYNVEKYLDRCLDSVCKQSLTDIEIICVDDCSPDNSYKIVEQYVAKDSRVTLIKHEKNLGLGGARNTAIRIAKADFIASVDSDDYMLPDMLKQLWLASEEGSFDVVCCSFNRVDALGNILSYETYPEKIIANENNSINIFSVMNPAFWNKLWRKSLFTENEIFFPVGDYFEDMPTTPRLLSKAKKIRIIDDRLYHYFVRTGSISNTFSPKHLIDYFKGFEIILNFLEENDLVERYNDEFMAYVNGSIRYHSETVVASGMNKNQLEQYFRQFLMLKVAFFENRSLFKNKNIGELLELLKQPNVPSSYGLKNKELLNDITSKDVALNILELENSNVLEEGLSYQNKIIIKEQERIELLDELVEVKHSFEISKQEILKYKKDVETYKEERFNLENQLKLVKQEHEQTLFKFSKQKTNIQVIEKEKINALSEKKNALSEKESALSKILEFEEVIQVFKQEKKEAISSSQTFGVFLFGFLFRLFISKKQSIKLKKHPRLFFKDSKNKFTRLVGGFLKII